jgi:hypothetical protein
MRILIAIVVTVLLLAAALVALAPAALIDMEARNLSGGSVRLAQTSGTIWNGAGDIVLTPGDVRVPLTWQLDPLPMLRGELTGTVTAGAGTPGTFAVGRDHFSLSHVSLALPAPALMRAGNAPAVLAAVGGTIDAQVNTLARNGDQLDGGFSARWRDASLPGPRPDVRIALGDLRVDVAGSGTELPGTIANVGGDVELSGTVALSVATARINAVVRPRVAIDSERGQAIDAALRVMGQPDGSGGFRLAWTAPLR